MEKVKIARIARNNKTSREGKPYVSLGLQTNEYGDVWLNGFGNKSNEHWKEGDEVEIEIKKVVKGDREYLNFDTPKKEDVNTAAVQTTLGKINYKLDMIIAHLSGKTKLTSEPGIPSNIDYPEDDSSQIAF